MTDPIYRDMYCVGRCPACHKGEMKPLAMTPDKESPLINVYETKHDYGETNKPKLYYCDARAGVMIALLKRAYGNKFIDDLTAFDNDELPVTWQNDGPTLNFNWGFDPNEMIKGLMDGLNSAFGVKSE